MLDMGSSSSSSSRMNMVFNTDHTTPLYSTLWTPKTSGVYAGLCIFLVFLAIVLRLLMAGKSVLEQRWLAQARKRRYIKIEGRLPEADRIDNDPDAKSATLVTAHGLEDKVKVVRADARGAVPFRLTVDLPRACLVFVIAGVSYLLMLAVMTMNVGYFMSVLAGTFLGELLVGRYIHWEEH